MQSEAAAPARLSSSSFSSEAGTQQGAATTATAAGRDQGGGSITDGFTGLLSSAAAAVAQQLGATGYFGAAEASSSEAEERSLGGAEAVPEPGPWQLRCAVVSNLIFHIDVMAGWTYAFQVGSCSLLVALGLAFRSSAAADCSIAFAGGPSMFSTPCAACRPRAVT